MYFRAGPEQARRLFQHKIRNLCRTELQRLDRASMGHGTELRVPFLDLALVELAMRLPRAFKQRDGQDKWILPRGFCGRFACPTTSGPARPKDMMSCYSSGLPTSGPGCFQAAVPGCTKLVGGYGLLELRLRRDFDTVFPEGGRRA